MELSSFVVLVLLATVILRMAFVAAIVWLVIPQRRQCPKCGGETTLPLLSPRALRVVRLERRWCLGCSWEGISKRVVGQAAPSAGLTEPVPSGDSDDGRWKARWDDDSQWRPKQDEGWR